MQGKGDPRMQLKMGLDPKYPDQQIRSLFVHYCFQLDPIPCLPTGP